LTYLAFLAATMCYLFLGPGGPLHRDSWFALLKRRVEALEPEFGLGVFLLVVIPSAGFALLYGVLEQIFGGAAMLLLGTAALFFSFGRLDWVALVERCRARATVEDYQGVALVIEEAGGDPIQVEDLDEFGRVVSRALLYEGFQRWFPPALYFILIGPVGAVAYRLIQLASDDSKVPVGSLRYLVDWLPARLLWLSFGVVGNLAGLRGAIGDRLMDPEINTDELLLEGLESALDVARDSTEESQPLLPLRRVERVYDGIKGSFFLWLITVSVLVILS
jgi:AmpE protein